VSAYLLVVMEADTSDPSRAEEHTLFEGHEEFETVELDDGLN
jgi:hypothetical protein